MRGEVGSLDCREGLSSRRTIWPRAELSLEIGSCHSSFMDKGLVLARLREVVPELKVVRKTNCITDTSRFL